jgi:DNA-binding SARP family transcriptional activator/tetratricopeptide (TPR) repeat protein
MVQLGMGRGGRVAGETEFCLLGPLAVRRDGVAVPVLPGKQRVVLAALLLARGRPVGPDELAAALWGTEVPASARASLQNYVARLRKALGDGGPPIVTGPGGYQMEAGPDHLDVTRFEAAVTAGRAAARAGAWGPAADGLRAGLALWRGDPLTGVPSELLAAREVPRLAELRLQALEARMEADLHLGRPGEVIAELRVLTAAEPLRERLHALLITALYQDGQQAGALAAYQAARTLLVSELGAEPGPELRRLQEQVLAGKLAVPAAPGPAPAGQPGEVRYSLPPDTTAFTGRDAELGRIAAAVGPGADPAAGGVVAIRAIDGMPGVGKTALAVHAAHLLRGRFPGPQLFVDLGGHTPGQEPVAPEAALAGLLAAAGVDPRYLPPDLSGRAALWRDRMAGQRVLLVLDNAASSAQVIPLLPGGDDCLVLVTSRRHLADLPGAVVPVMLATLPPAKAREMFVRLAPRAAAGPAPAVAELMALAGFLPLAISLLARVYNRHPAWSLADLTAETRSRLLTLAAENDSVAAAFGVSYQHLDAGQQEFFRRLGLHPGTIIDAYAAAALAGRPLAEAAAGLDALHGEGLLTETGYRRYGMHDLIRRYAADRAAGDPPAVRDAATGRLLDYYQHTAERADDLMARHPRSGPARRDRPGHLTRPAQRGHRAQPGRPGRAAEPDQPALPDRAEALAWVRAERANLLACLDYAGRTGQLGRVVALTAGVAAILRQDGPWAEALARHAAAAAAAADLGDRAGQAGALKNLGDLRRLTGDHPGAARAAARALALYRDLGDRIGQANALNHLGDVRALTGDYPGAVQALEEALAIFRDIGSRLGQANALDNLGALRRAAGDYPGAVRILDEALGIFRDLGDRQGQASALSNLADVWQLTSDYRSAAQAAEEALGISRDIGNKLGQANALNILGDVRRQTGDYRGAARVLDEALGMFRDIGSRLGQAGALFYLGDVRRMTGDYPGAARAQEEALSMYRTLGSRPGQANSLLYLGIVWRESGRYAEAAAALADALARFRELGSVPAQVEALNETGSLHLARGDADQARACHQQALDLAREIASPRDEAAALAGLGRCALSAGDTAEAVDGLRRAQVIFERIGAAEAAGIAAELGALPARS